MATSTPNDPAATRAAKNAANTAAPTLVLLAAAVGFFMVILDTTVVNVALGRIQSTFDAGVNGLEWVVDAYALVFAGLLLAGGALGDRFGVRRLFATGLATFTAASVACGAAPSLGTLIAARVLQGVGAALLLPASLSALRHAYPNAQARSRAVGLWTTAGSAGLAIGPVIGGVLVDTLGWRSIFWLNLPVGLVAIALVRRAVAPGTTHAAAERVNVPGQLAGVAGLSALAFALIEGPAQGWTASPVLIAGAVALIGLVAFVVLERTHEPPLIPLRLWRNHGFSAATSIGFIVNFSFYGLIFFLGLFLQQYRHLSPLRTGLLFLPLTASVIAANLLSGPWMAKHGPRAPMRTGHLIALAGFAGLALRGATGGDAEFMGYLLVVGFGTGLVVPSMVAAVMAAAPTQDAGIAAGALNTSRQIGGVFGVALLGSLVATTHDYPFAMRAGGLGAGLLLLLGLALTLGFVKAGWPAGHTGEWERALVIE